MAKIAIITLIVLIFAIIAVKSLLRSGNQALEQIKITPMLLTSPAFKDGGDIPEKYSCDGGGINPQLDISNIPNGAESLALVMDDPDATGGRTFTHWLIWNINPGISVIKQESIPPESVEGKNDAGRIGYLGPCPPKGSNPHHYRFKLYALAARLNLPAGATKSELETEIDKHVLGRAELTGLYKRK